MPYDAEVEDGFATNSNLTNEKARGILYLLESKLREIDGSLTILHPYTKYTLEHLMPQDWETNWPLPDDLNEVEKFEFKNNRNKAIATLGNMAIITQSLNSKVSNNQWKKKLDGGLKVKAGDLLTMKDVINQSEWDETTIASRAEWLAVKANEVWENVISSGEADEEEMETARNTLDYTQYSLDNGVTYTSKSAFVVSAVKAYAAKHNSTIEQLREVFPANILKNFKRIGFICTREDIANKALNNGRIPTMEEKQKWYHCNVEANWAKDSQGVDYIVNTEITKFSAQSVRGIMEADGFIVKTKQNV